MSFVALAVTPGVPHFELAAACAVFGVDRSDLIDPWHEFAVCGADAMPVGGRFRLEPEGDSTTSCTRTP